MIPVMEITGKTNVQKKVNVKVLGFYLVGLRGNNTTFITVRKT